MVNGRLPCNERPQNCVCLQWEMRQDHGSMPTWARASAPDRQMSPWNMLQIWLSRRTSLGLGIPSLSAESTIRSYLDSSWMEGMASTCIACFRSTLITGMIARSISWHPFATWWNNVTGWWKQDSPSTRSYVLPQRFLQGHTFPPGMQDANSSQRKWRL